MPEVSQGAAQGHGKDLGLLPVADTIQLATDSLTIKEKLWEVYGPQIEQALAERGFYVTARRDPVTGAAAPAGASQHSEPMEVLGRPVAPIRCGQIAGVTGGSPVQLERRHLGLDRSNVAEVAGAAATGVLSSFDPSSLVPALANDHKMTHSSACHQLCAACGSALPSPLKDWHSPAAVGATYDQQGRLHIPLTHDTTGRWASSYGVNGVLTLAGTAGTGTPPRTFTTTQTVLSTATSSGLGDLVGNTNRTSNERPAALTPNAIVSIAECREKRLKELLSTSAPLRDSLSKAQAHALASLIDCAQRDLQHAQRKHAEELLRDTMTGELAKDSPPKAVEQVIAELTSLRGEALKGAETAGSSNDGGRGEESPADQREADVKVLQERLQQLVAMKAVHDRESLLAAATQRSFGAAGADAAVSNIIEEASDVVLNRELIKEQRSRIERAEPQSQE